MRKVSKDDRLFFYERSFFTLDGLWIVELENETDWKTALKVDIVVWQRFYKIVFRRVKRYLDVDTNTLQDLAEIISFCWSCEGYEYEITKNEPGELIMNITQCPYKSAMDRNPERHERIRDICIRMCVPFYEPALEEFNPNIQLDRNKFLGVGDEVCNFHFILKNE